MHDNKDLKRRILDISYKLKLSHLGSCLTAVDIIDEIYSVKQPDEKFVLSSGHAALALYCVIEKYERLDAEKIFQHHGVHPDRCSECHIYCSTGSLGNGLPIALGMALANRDKRVWCLISDGECAEGSIWEALAIRDKYQVKNLNIFVNYNGWGAYDYIDLYKLANNLVSNGIPRTHIKRTDAESFPFLSGQKGHYAVMSEEDYRLGLEILK